MISEAMLRILKMGFVLNVTASESVFLECLETKVHSASD